MKDTDIAWLAGLYEGEGSCLARYEGYRVSIPSTDLDVLQRVQALVGGGSIRPVPLRPGHLGKKPIYRWEISRREEVEGFLHAVLPYLLSRRAKKAHEVITAARASLARRKAYRRAA